MYKFIEIMAYWRYFFLVPNLNFFIEIINIGNITIYNSSNTFTLLIDLWLTVYNNIIKYLYKHKIVNIWRRSIVLCFFFIFTYIIFENCINRILKTSEECYRIKITRDPRRFLCCRRSNIILLAYLKYKIFRNVI